MRVDVLDVGPGQAGVAAMNTPNNPATSVVCFCDPVAPQFSYSASAQNNYWPESILATNQSMDFDSSGQTYVDKNGQSRFGSGDIKFAITGSATSTASGIKVSLMT